MSGKFAEGTSVSVQSSQAEIARIVTRYGATGFMMGWNDGSSAVAFVFQGRQVRFTVPTDVDLEEFRYTATKQRRSDAAAQQAAEKEVMRRWRALALAIKAKLEVVETGIATFEEEFMAHVVMPDGRTFAEYALPAIDRSYATSEPPVLQIEAPR